MPAGRQDATEEQIERMNNNCAVCWSEMGPPLMPRAPLILMGAGGSALAHLHTAPQSLPGKSLPCGHAFHEACIKQWLVQCHGCAAALLPKPRRLIRHRTSATLRQVVQAWANGTVLAAAGRAGSQLARCATPR